MPFYPSPFITIDRAPPCIDHHAPSYAPCIVLVQGAIGEDVMLAVGSLSVVDLLPGLQVHACRYCTAGTHMGPLFISDLIFGNFVYL